MGEATSRSRAVGSPGAGVVDDGGEGGL